MACGKKKTAENVHRARNLVTRPEITETMSQLEERYRSWKKDTAYLKDIGAYDFRDQTMASILMDFVPDVHKEISMKHETAGEKGQQFEYHTAHDGEDHPEGEGQSREWEGQEKVR